MPTRQTPPGDVPIHVFVRGVRKLPIVLDDYDRWRFLDGLYRFAHAPPTPNPGAMFGSALPREMGERLVQVHAFCLRDNHFHLLVEASDGTRVSRFLQRLLSGYAKYLNTRHGTSGAAFEASFGWRAAKNAADAVTLFCYVSVVNGAEPFVADRETARPETLIAAAMANPFCSLQDYFGDRRLPAVTTEKFRLAIPSARDLLRVLRNRRRRPTESAHSHSTAPAVTRLTWRGRSVS